MFLALAAGAALVADPFFGLDKASQTGVWRSQGYGYVLDVGDAGVREGAAVRDGGQRTGGGQGGHGHPSQRPER